jgi:hypothetical protein
MKLTEATFNIGGFIGSQDVIIKSVPVEDNGKGELVKAEGQKWAHVADVIKLNGKYGEFLMNPLEEADRETQDTYYISATNPANRGSRKPVATLRVKYAGATESEHVCGLFLRYYAESGQTSLIGTDVENGMRYGIFLNEPKDEAQKVAVNQ